VVVEAQEGRGHMSERRAPLRLSITPSMKVSLKQDNLSRFIQLYVEVQ
jgi:hypothetical protein